MTNKLCKHFNTYNHNCIMLEKHIFNVFNVSVNIVCPVRPNFGNCKQYEEKSEKMVKVND